MTTQPTPRPDSPKPALAALGLVAGVYFCLALLVLPTGGYWSIDVGYKRIQAYNVRLGAGLDLSVRYPGQAVDPALAYVPFGPLFHYRAGGRIYFTQPAAISLLAQPFLLLLGERGERVVPLLAGLACTYLAGHLLSVLGGTPPWAAVLLTGLATPIVFYSLQLWEHTLAAALALGALALVLRADGESPRLRVYLLSGLLAGLAGSVRRDSLLLALMLGLGLAWDGWRRPSTRRRAVAWGAVAAVTLLATWWVGYLNNGRLIPPELSISFVPRLTGRAYILAHPADSLADFVFGPPAGALGRALLGVTMAYGLAVRLPWRWLREGMGAGLLAALAVGTAWLWPTYAADGRVFGVLSAAPWLALALVPAALRPAPARRLAVIGAGFWALTTLALGLLTPYGPWHTALEWGTRFALSVFPLGAVFATAGLWELWRRGRDGRWERLHLAAALAVVGVSLGLQALGVQVQHARVTQRRAEQQAVLALPEMPLLTNLEWLAADMPEVYATRPLFLFNDEAQLADLLQKLYASGAREAAFLGYGMLDPAALERAAPEGTRLEAVEARRLAGQVYLTHLALSGIGP